VFGIWNFLKNLLRRCLGVQTPTHIFGMYLAEVSSPDFLKQFFIDPIQQASGRNLTAEFAEEICCQKLLSSRLRISTREMLQLTSLPGKPSALFLWQ